MRINALSRARFRAGIAWTVPALGQIATGEQPMNTANLQLEGLYLAIAAVNRALVRNGILTAAEVDAALDAAAMAAGADRPDGLSMANRDAVAFPIRLLRLANQRDGDQPIPGFSELARAVGETRDP